MPLDLRSQLMMAVTTSQFQFLNLERRPMLWRTVVPTLLCQNPLRQRRRARLRPEMRKRMTLVWMSQARSVGRRRQAGLRRGKHQSLPRRRIIRQVTRRGAVRMTLVRSMQVRLRNYEKGKLIMHLKNHGPHFEHVDRTYCPPLADPALKRSPSVRTSPYARKVVRRS